jgi:hypothetical protein
MVQRIIDFVVAKADTIQTDYSVNPWVFLVLLVACAPFFYFSIYRLARAAVSKDSKSLFTWSSVFLGATSLPYLYVLVFGRNMPWWIYLIFAVLLVQGGATLVKKIRRPGATRRST